MSSTTFVKRLTSTVLEPLRHNNADFKIANDSFVLICKDKLENEEHFMIKCPYYSPLRLVLERECIEHCYRYADLNEEHFSDDKRK